MNNRSSRPSKRRLQSYALIVACASAFGTLELADSPARADTTAVVDPSIQYQTWQGWGTSLAWWAKVVGGFPEPIRSDYMEKAFDPIKGLGLNVVRYNIGGGENPAHLAPNKEFLSFRANIPGYESSPGVWDWAVDTGQRWVLNAAIKKGANQLEAFSNSPPWWATVSGSVTGNIGGKDNLRDDAGFADYLTSVVQHFHDAWGITFRDLEPLNEPTNGWQYGAPFNGQEGCVVDRSHQNAIIKATAASLARRKIVGVSVTASDETSISAANETFGYYDAATLKGLSKINAHTYGGGDRTRLSALALGAGKDLWMSEYGDGDATGLALSQRILEDMNGLHPTAWVYWQFVDGGGWGMLTNPLDSFQHTDYGVNKKYWVMGNYSKFIRPSFRLIAITDPNSLAAYDVKSGALVIVTTNSGETDAPVTYDLSKFTRLGSSASGYRTSPTQNLTKLPSVTLQGKRLTATIPAKSVTTYVIQGAAYTGALGFNYSDFYHLVNRGTGLPLDVSQPSTANASASRQWSLRGIGGGEYKIVNRNSGQTLDVSQSSTLAGADLIQYPDNGGDNQIWRLKHVSDGFWEIINRHSGLVLDAGAKAAGAGLTQQTDNGSAGQQWRLVLQSKGTL